MKKLYILLTLLSVTFLLNAQNEVIRPPRLKVGVVLGGGGARGASHIGVLKYMEEMGIPIDYVAGTSMGSIMGGFYAMGYPPDELASLIANINWSEYIGNTIDRPLMSENARQRNSTLMLEIPFSHESLFSADPNASFLSELPSAYVSNSSLVNLFNDLCVGYQSEMDFNDLPIPFACVATDLITGDEVVMRSGSVPTAMRASMAIPGVFSPVIVGDKVLVDGGLVNNFPADVLREMGADIIIGVEVTSTKDITISDLQSLPQVLSRLVTNSTSAKRVENREMCDIHIVPDCSGYGMLSFTPEAIETLVGRGYEKASEYHDQFKAIKDAIDASAGYSVTKTLHAPRANNLANEPVLINSITFNNVSNRESRWLTRKGHLKIGERYDQNDIEHAIKIYRGTGCFDEITYQVKEHDSIHSTKTLSDSYDLIINMKPAQPHVVGLGLRYDTEEGAALLVHLGINEKKFNGSKFLTDIKLSYNPKINLTYTYSRSSLANFNIAYDYRDEHFRTTDIYTSSLVNLRYHQHKASVYVSQFHLLNLSTTVGASYTGVAFDNSSMEGGIMDSILFMPNKFITPFVTIKYDNLNDAYFARRGLYASLSPHYYWDTKNSENNNIDLCYTLKYYLTPWNGRLTIIPQVYGRYLYNPDTGFYNLLSSAGGEVEGRHFDNQMPFIGITYEESFNYTLVNVARCDLRYNLLGNHYLTAMYNALLSPNTTIYHGAGLKYSYKSLLGPISLTAQWTNLYRGHFGFYASFGFTF